VTCALAVTDATAEEKPLQGQPENCRTRYQLTFMDPWHILDAQQYSACRDAAAASERTRAESAQSLRAPAQARSRGSFTTN
jgi:hypothetical protein